MFHDPKTHLSSMGRQETTLDAEKTNEGISDPILFFTLKYSKSDIF